MQTLTVQGDVPPSDLHFSACWNQSTDISPYWIWTKKFVTFWGFLCFVLFFIRAMINFYKVYIFAIRRHWF